MPVDYLLIYYLPYFLHIDQYDCNNSSMMAAKEASDMVLMSLLSTLVYSTNKMEAKNEYIHHKNKSGDTLLKIIISHGDTLSMHREVMIKVCFIYTSFSSLSFIYVCFVPYILTCPLFVFSLFLNVLSCALLCLRWITV